MTKEVEDFEKETPPVKSCPESGPVRSRTHIGCEKIAENNATKEVEDLEDAIDDNPNLKNRVPH